MAGNSKLVGGYPLSDLLYPAGKSKFYLSRNMRNFWANFAKTGSPGTSTNSIKWEKNINNSYLVLDKKKNLRMQESSVTFRSLSEELFNDQRVNDLEKCVILLQMFTFVGNDIYDENIKNYRGNCNRNEAEQFIKDNASYIEY